MSLEDIGRHIDIVRQLSKPGGALSVDAPSATVKNPQWFPGGRLSEVRELLHNRILEEQRKKHPNVEQGRLAIVLAGPPGAGKGTMLKELLGSNEEKFLVADADEFKRSLLEEALADGSYERIKPPEIRELEASGEQFFPLEMAALVHQESSKLAARCRTEAIDRGDNLVIDTVLSSQDSAREIGRMLSAAGYGVQVVDVEVPFEVSEAQIRGRWEESYLKALSGEDELGGRWVPSEYARDVFDGPDEASKPEAAARILAEDCPAVTRYRVFRRETHQLKSIVAVDKVRTIRGGPLIANAPHATPKSSNPTASGIDATTAVRRAFPGTVRDAMQQTNSNPQTPNKHQPSTLGPEHERD